MTAFFILCLLPALLATTRAQETLTCQVCSGTADSCKNPTQTCPVPKATGGCITLVEENSQDGTKMLAFYKGCINDYNIGIKVPITFTAGTGKYLRINTSRCNNADNCNSAVLDVPKENTALNGLQCPTCFALNSDPCDSQITPCRGDETYCFDFSGTQNPVSSPSSVKTFAAKGCATASAQDIKTGDALQSAVTVYRFTKATSKPATSGGSQALGKFSFALYLPSLAGLLLVKLLH
ncbi:phospholipase A2 inhibitor and Ly6/PLAUR domain-containing protein-like [Emydura macquarii macquarii]|uniref:phospholipase A2 inhibitor and Ly6/PLAUR domain-containing protein-like n=1 Tax=Emydura macquarii macquarii TaxID=1129001 RepID=UPI00352A681E